VCQYFIKKAESSLKGKTGNKVLILLDIAENLNTLLPRYKAVLEIVCIAITNIHNSYAHAVTCTNITYRYFSSEYQSTPFYDDSKVWGAAAQCMQESFA